MVPANRRDSAVCKELDGLVGKEVIVDEVATADELIASEPIDLCERVGQRVNVRVDIRDDRQPEEAHLVSMYRSGNRLATVAASLAQLGSSTRGTHPSME